MVQKEVEIVNRLGMHARAASVFVKAATGFSSTILVRCCDREGNGKSIMSMMMLQATFGSTVTLEIEGDDEADAMTTLTDLIAGRFGEAE